MRIAICGSMSLAKEMIHVKKELERRGHSIVIQKDVEDYASGKILDEDKWKKLEIDPLKTYYEEIKHSDAIIVINIDRKGILNYIGGNTLIEMAFAYVLNKRIFLLHPIPKMPYEDEIYAMTPIVINNDLDLVKP